MNDKLSKILAKEDTSVIKKVVEELVRITTIRVDKKENAMSLLIEYGPEDERPPEEIDLPINVRVFLSSERKTLMDMLRKLVGEPFVLAERNDDMLLWRRKSLQKKFDEYGEEQWGSNHPLD